MLISWFWYSGDASAGTFPVEVTSGSAELKVALEFRAVFVAKVDTDHVYAGGEAGIWLDLPEVVGTLQGSDGCEAETLVYADINVGAFANADFSIADDAIEEDVVGKTIQKTLWTGPTDSQCWAGASSTAGATSTSWMVGIPIQKTVHASSTSEARVPSSDTIKSTYTQLADASVHITAPSSGKVLENTLSMSVPTATSGRDNAKISSISWASVAVTTVPSGAVVPTSTADTSVGSVARPAPAGARAFVIAAAILGPICMSIL